jgi:hypothetical protein
MMHSRDDDEFLRSAFRSAPGPQAPDMEGRVRQRIRRKRAWKLGAAALTVIGMAVAIAVLWNQQTRKADPTPVAHVPSQSPRPEPESPIPASLFAGPPIHSLDTVTHQRDAYVSALKRLVEE